jgi:SpoVK/Ycf46/Vps4 family AAA+-type ATPase
MMRPGRLDVKVYVPLPDPAARFRLFEIYFDGRPLDDDVDFAKLVEITDGYSGADIKAIAERAATRPFLESILAKKELGNLNSRNINMQDLVITLEEIPPSVSSKDVAKYDEWATKT